MIIKDNEIKIRQINCHLDDLDLLSILSKYVAQQSGFKIDPRKTRIQVIIRKKDTSTGFKDEAEVTLTNDIE